MANQFSTFSLLLLFLLAFQEMMPSEAAMCSAPSRLFTGVCLSRSNCAAICEKEGFLYGVCKRLKCVCTKDCNNGGGGDGGGEGPPDQGGDGGGEQPPVLF